jgi:hypothetical protein
MTRFSPRLLTGTFTTAAFDRSSFRYTSHYNKKLNKCFVDVHGLTLVSDEHKAMESDHIYDALEDTVLGGRVILRKDGQDGQIESVVLIKDSHPIRDEQERAAFVPWFQSLMAE